MSEREKQAFARFVEIIRQLRAPNGCPWDREQTLESLSPHLIEEAFETTDAIRSGTASDIGEELGDVYLLATMLSVIHSESTDSGPAEILDEASEKLLRRHPHVFGEAVAKDSVEVKQQWDQIKEHVEGRKRDRSALSGVSKGLPPLERASQLQKRARKVGFDWPAPDAVIAKVYEELAEVEEALSRSIDSPHSGAGNFNQASEIMEPETTEPDSAAPNRDRLSEELGDLLFSVINLSRFLKINPDLALHNANEKFARRFRHMEQQMQAEGVEMSADQVQRMNELWTALKQHSE